jgi:hypothetical protein
MLKKCQRIRVTRGKPLGNFRRIISQHKHSLPVTYQKLKSFPSGIRRSAADSWLFRDLAT